MSDASVRAGTDSIEQLAESLHEALIRARPVPPLTERNPALGVADAYAIQQINLGRALAAGATLVGRKIGLTSEPMQKLLGVDEPDFGYILDSMLVPDCGTIVRSRMCAPRVEPEIAFRLSRPLSGPGVTIDDVLDATEYVAAALEIVDSRIDDWRITLPDTVADNASSGMVVLGLVCRQRRDHRLRARVGGVGSSGRGGGLAGQRAGALRYRNRGRTIRHVRFDHRRLFCGHR